MKDNESTEKGSVTWNEIGEFEKSNDLLKEENLWKMIEMVHNLDFSTIPDDVNINNEEWLRKKAEAKETGQKRLKEEGR